jgi:hypothetical protein
MNALKTAAPPHHSSNGYTNTIFILQMDLLIHFSFFKSIDECTQSYIEKYKVCFPAIFTIMYLRPIVLIYLQIGLSSNWFHKPIFGKCWQRGHVRDTSLWLVCLFCFHEYFVASYKLATEDTHFLSDTRISMTTKKTSCLLLCWIANGIGNFLHMSMDHEFFQSCKCNDISEIMMEIQLSLQ